MKKIFALLPMVAAFALCGCGNDKEKESEGEKGSNLEFTEEQAKAKVRELAQTEGFEITFKYTSSDSESNEVSETTLGQKDGYTWWASSGSQSMWKETETTIVTYSYDENSGKYSVAYTYNKAELQETYGEAYSRMYSLDIYATFLYMGNMYDGYEGYHKVKDLTYVGRSATQYDLKESNGLAYVTATVIIDKATGITLYWGVAGADVQGNSGSASYQVTSFKTGSEVSVPAIQE